MSDLMREFRAMDPFDRMVFVVALLTCPPFLFVVLFEVAFPSKNEGGVP